MKFRMPGAIAIVMMLAMSVTAFCEEPKEDGVRRVEGMGEKQTTESAL